MSKYKILAVAIAATLAAPATFAATFVSSATPAVAHTKEAITGNTSKAANQDPIVFTLKAGDFLIGRSSAFRVEITLSGAEFADTGNSVTSLQDDAVTDKNKFDIANEGGSGAQYAFSMVPDDGADPQNVMVGDLFQFDAGDLNLTKVTADTVTATVKVRDLATGLELMSTSGTVMTLAKGTKISATAATPDKIDVTTGKTEFAGGTKVVQLGSVVVGTAATATSMAGSGIAGNTALGNLFQYDAANDKLELTVTAADAAAFTPVDEDDDVTGIYIATDGTCDATDTQLTVSEDDPNVFTGTAALGATGATALVCGVVNGETEIADKGFSVSGKINFKDAGISDVSLASADLATLSYNGPVVKVYHFNPASNPDQVSYLRITNTSSVGGRITINGVCDNGVASATAAQFNLPKQQSVLLTSKDIEQGNAAKGVTGGLGACATGKYRLTVTGEIGSMEVQNFLRNVTSAGTVNTNVNNEK